MNDTATATPHCDARVGFYAGEFAEMPLACSITVGLDSWIDITGRIRRGCRWHRSALLYRHPAMTEAQRVALAIERISRDFDEERNPEGDPSLNGAWR
jgi:hypothetical protein